MLINPEVRAVIHSLDHSPEEWEPDYIRSKLYWLRHRALGVNVWTANRACGVEITVSNGNGRFETAETVWGGVTGWSTIGLSPSHWALSAAIRRWEKRFPIEKPSAARLFEAEGRS